MKGSMVLGSMFCIRPCYGVALQRKLVSIVDRPETFFCFAQSTFVITTQLGSLNSLIAYV